MAAYQIFTDATADLSPEMLTGLPHLEIIPMEIEIAGGTYIYGPSGTISIDHFYELQRTGNFAFTSQINPAVYFQTFSACLQDGKDILYLCFTSGMSGTFQTARLCIDELEKEYPERKIICVDTLAASIGEGFLVCEALRKQTEGCSLEELADWVMKNRLKVCHWFTVDTFDHLKHGGRVSAAAAALGTVLQIKPLLRVDEEGCLKVVEKPRGRKNAIAAQLSRIHSGWIPDMGNKIVIAHGDCSEGAEQLRQAVSAQFPEAEIVTSQIGPIIGAHTGPGMLAVSYWGNTR